MQSRRRRERLGMICLCAIICSSMTWGFYGHRLINRMAIFTLPKPLFGFYKEHSRSIEAISTAPDKRRNTSPVEAVRHYIDLDHWASYDQELLRQSMSDVILTFAEITVESLDTSIYYDGLQTPMVHNDWVVDHYIELYDSVATRIYDFIIDREVQLSIDSTQVTIVDQFTEHGIVPYHLKYYYLRLVKVMREQNIERIVKLSGEIGHYISDAHVPLHTTENYNGQLTGQEGIHAFWETRIPELFAENEYDFFVEPAAYIEDVDSFFWSMTLESNRLVDEVLSVEMSMRKEYPQDQQYCYERRGNRVERLPCPEYSHAYQDRMKNMVERRMTQAISAVGSIWYSAWMDAGQPKLSMKNNLIDIPFVIDTVAEGTHDLRIIPNNENHH